MSDGQYDDMSDEISKLAAELADCNPLWLKFANRFIECDDRHDAYVFAYPDATDRRGAQVSAHKLLQKPVVVEYIKAVRSFLARQELMTLDEIRTEVQKRAFANMTEFIGMEVRVDEDSGEETFVPVIKKATDDLSPQQQRMIKSITMTKMGPKFEIADQRGYMDMLIKMIGGYAPEKVAMTDANGNDKPTISIEVVGVGKSDADE
ncbi:MAG: terminase small subunit [Aeromonas sp.]